MNELDWVNDGAIIFRGLIPPEDIDAFLNFQQQTYFDKGVESRDDDFLIYPEVRDLVCHKQIYEAFQQIEVEGAVEACLLEWFYKPTGWHSDRLPGMTRTAGVIIVLEEMDPASGLFEMIPGSHNWELELGYCKPQADGGTGEYLQEKIAPHLDSTYRFHGTKGDVLIWNSELIHRRSPRTADLPRKTVVTLCHKPLNQVFRHNDGFFYSLSI